MGYYDCNSSFCFGKCSRCKYYCDKCSRCNKCIEPVYDPTAMPKLSPESWAYLELRKKDSQDNYARKCWCKLEDKCVCIIS